MKIHGIKKKKTINKNNTAFKVNNHLASTPNVGILSDRNKAKAKQR